MKKSKAMILAAGRGRRMLNLSSKTPKPLIKVNGKPIISNILNTIQNAKISNCVINTSYLSEELSKYAQEYNTKTKKPFIKLSYEKTKLETGGGVKKALGLLSDSEFIIINGSGRTNIRLFLKSNNCNCV